MFTKLIEPLKSLHGLGWRRSGHGAESEMQSGLSRHLCVVSRRDRGLYEELRQSFANNLYPVEVILDRRHQDRRRQTTSMRVDRRRKDRRSFNVDGSLLRFGWALAPTKTD